MTVHMIRELEKLKKMILELAAVVEESVQKSVRALVDEDVELAKQIVAGDNRVDDMEVELEEECLKILALHQPVAADLRFIVSVLKINNDLERMADLATNIAERAIDLSGPWKVVPPFDVEEMARQTERMIDLSLEALVHQDRDTAARAIALDDKVDQLHAENFAQVKTCIRERPEKMDGYIYYLSISRYIERIADLATNIGEDVIYMIDGKIVRHIEDWNVDI
ncbi:MAG: phosphate transport system regulatory protein PhoU [Desulfuromonas sp.]|nr:MAG: phosphate transport system regulatory protein PhoU [Desulfuromonas sp.]